MDIFNWKQKLIILIFLAGNVFGGLLLSKDSCPPHSHFTPMHAHTHVSRHTGFFHEKIMRWKEKDL